MTGAKRGRKPSPLPTGIVSLIRKRWGVEFYAEGWPDVGPTFVVSKREPSGRRPGRPAGRKPVMATKPSEERARTLKTPRARALRDGMLAGLELIVLRARMQTYETRRYSRESAVLAAMADFRWPNRSARELKRLLLTMRRGL